MPDTHTADGFPNVEGLSDHPPCARPEAQRGAGPRVITARELCELDVRPDQICRARLYRGGPDALCRQAETRQVVVLHGDRACRWRWAACAWATCSCAQGDVLYLALEDNCRRLQSRLRRLWQCEAAARVGCRKSCTSRPTGRAPTRAASRRSANGSTSTRRAPRDRGRAGDVQGARRRAATRRFTRPTIWPSRICEASRWNRRRDRGGASHAEGRPVEADPFEKVSGTLGLSGAADTTIILDRDQNGCTLYGRGRDIEEIETAVQFDASSTCRWRLGEGGEVRRTDERSVILACWPRVAQRCHRPRSPTRSTSTTTMCGSCC